MRITVTVAQVLRAFLDDPAAPLYGLEVMGKTGLRSGALYPVLARLERVGWLCSQWELVDPGRAGRPRRRYYQLSVEGLAVARVELAALAAHLRPPSRGVDGVPAPEGRLAR